MLQQSNTYYLEKKKLKNLSKIRKIQMKVIELQNTMTT